MSEINRFSYICRWVKVGFGISPWQVLNYDVGPLMVSDRISRLWEWNTRIKTDLFLSLNQQKDVWKCQQKHCFPKLRFYCNWEQETKLLLYQASPLLVKFIIGISGWCWKTFLTDVEGGLKWNSVWFAPLIWYSVRLMKGNKLSFPREKLCSSTLKMAANVQLSLDLTNVLRRHTP